LQFTDRWSITELMPQRNILLLITEKLGEEYMIAEFKQAFDEEKAYRIKDVCSSLVKKKRFNKAQVALLVECGFLPLPSRVDGVGPVWDGKDLNQWNVIAKQIRIIMEKATAEAARSSWDKYEKMFAPLEEKWLQSIKKTPAGKEENPAGQVSYFGAT